MTHVAILVQPAILRVGCTEPTFKDPSCLDQYTEYANGSTAGIRFCGTGQIENTISYCCDDGKHDVGSFACCQNSSSIFQISPAAIVLAQMPFNQLTTTATSASSTSTSMSSTSRSAIATNSMNPAWTSTQVTTNVYFAEYDNSNATKTRISWAKTLTAAESISAILPGYSSCVDSAYLGLEAP